MNSGSDLFRFLVNISARIDEIRGDSKIKTASRQFGARTDVKVSFSDDNANRPFKRHKPTVFVVAAG
jgi:hypothetical protein